MNWRRTTIPTSDRTALQRVQGAVGAFWDVATWGYLSLLAVVAVSRMSDTAVPIVLQPLQAGLPIVFAPVWIVLVVSAATKRWFQVPVALILSVTFIASVAPALEKAGRPYWVAAAPTVRIVSANMYFANDRTGPAVEAVLGRSADVIVVVEFTDALRIAFRNADPLFDSTYPFSVEKARADPGGIVVYSKLPIEQSIELTEQKTPAVRIALPNGQRLWLAAVHPFPPSSEAEGKRWIRSMKEFRRFAVGSAGDDALVLAGDFNGTRWQPSFGSLLAGPMIDAHEAVGKGLSRSWPVGGWTPALVRLDHAVMNPRAFPTAVEDFTVPGSDHRAFEVTVAVTASKAPGVAPGEDSIVTTTTRKPRSKR